ncbi:SusD/RagB family nutrient-binding outer membrane lipoprotein [Flavilitoribacter nigricans]|uniref:SusD/RagB family nutrient-binding outer membrane lipoprotein n=1 Tax=Flavilitoribacter nigricans (strain ATCC 23147 / DSM 23189 / NBRC 102662 / NCIMB 1420 / SS-2) TaxID=1122177 RepID=A0A2D0N7L9_FLAN2|nr:SusD/RagB family nutrient-binding outer membrane lipoprotein [Flavilitoribacter nigricans]PHN04514.1 SusD/RagB family nutrient-binding outer membrane lipoprotein [Flavilitoribacter nigricans DSM 23189 = NBRC 102662]
MKSINISILSLCLLLFAACQKEDFADAYADPSKIDETSIERQFTGVLVAGQDYIVPTYRNYFVTLRITLNPWTQSIGWINTPNQYIPGSSGVEDVWFNYYDVLAQFREFQKVWNATDADRQQKLRIFDLAARAFMYGETARMVDLFENIPFSQAGLLSTNSGDYTNSYAAFDSGIEIYKFILDDLKSIADEMITLEVEPAFQTTFAAQDFVNNGSVELWNRYVNSLRLRLLTRVSDHPDFTSRAASEIAEILNNPTSYPVVESNDQNIMIDIYDLDTPINAKGFQNGIDSDGWDGDDAGKKMIDFLVTSEDPRLRVLFEPGTDADGVYVGLDPMLTGSEQQELVNGGEIARYNRTTMSRNQFFPGVMINAAEVSFLKAEYYLENGDDAAAKAAYETGIRQSIEFYFYVNSLSNDSSVPTPEPATDEEIMDMLATEAVSWDAADSESEKLALIAYQKWVHFNIIQPYQNWAEMRRLDTPSLEFWQDNSSNQTLPPVRWTIPGNEITFNGENYRAVQSEDELENKLFWDVQ